MAICWDAKVGSSQFQPLSHRLCQPFWSSAASSRASMGTLVGIPPSPQWDAGTSQAWSRARLRPFSQTSLVAPYCAIPRDYLSDTPLSRYGVLVSHHGKLGAIPPPPFLSVSPLESMRSGGAIPPPQKGYLSDACAIPFENKAKACDTPLCDTISRGYCAISGGISHWAAKQTRQSHQKKNLKQKCSLEQVF